MRIASLATLALLLSTGAQAAPEGRDNGLQHGTSHRLATCEADLDAADDAIAVRDEELDAAWADVQACDEDLGLSLDALAGAEAELVILRAGPDATTATADGFGKAKYQVPCDLTAESGICLLGGARQATAGGATAILIPVRAEIVGSDVTSDSTSGATAGQLEPSPTPDATEGPVPGADGTASGADATADADDATSELGDDTSGAGTPDAGRNLPTHTAVAVVSVAHFVDDWQGESAYLKVNGRFYPYTLGDGQRKHSLIGHTTSSSAGPATVTVTIDGTVVAERAISAETEARLADGASLELLASPTVADDGGEGALFRIALADDEAGGLVVVAELDVSFSTVAE